MCVLMINIIKKKQNTSTNIQINYLINNVSSSISQNKTPSLRNSEITKLQDFRFFLFSIIVYDPIWCKISINANIEKTHIFYKIKYDFKSNSRSHKMTFLFKNSLFIQYIKLFDKSGIFLVINQHPEETRKEGVL